MNIVRALEVALPELPERIVRNIPPKLDPSVVAKEQLEKGERVVLAKKPGTDLIFRFNPAQWQLIHLFDGTRSPAELADLYSKQTGASISDDDVRELATYLQRDTPLLFKTPLEKNIALQEQLRSSRKKRSRFQHLDFADIVIKTWDNADGYVTRLYPRVRFIFTPWFVCTTLAMFLLMGWMWWDRFGEVWSDSFAFFNFTQKSGRDLIEFWFLFGATAAIHETAHGLVGKHFGATVEKMGFTLMYFAPSFFCDVTQVWVLGGKWARIATAIGGIWLDLVVCFCATVIWWGTTTGMTVHDWAYKIMMVTGVGVSILNLNPLIKLDGYLIFSELVHEPALKESSTEYLTAWVRNRLFRLPVEIPFVPRRRRAFFVTYAVLSGLYSYLLLSFLMVVTYHILRSFIPEWAFIPAAAMGFWVFRSRIKQLVNFMKTLYVDKKERVGAFFTPWRAVLATAAALVILCAPIWPDFVEARFVLQPSRTAVLHATVSGFVTGVLIQEGQAVGPGTPLLQLRNLELESQAAQANEALREATAEATQASLHYIDFAAREQERQRRAENKRLLANKLSQLTLTSPIAGTVLTPHVKDLVGRSVDEGDLLVRLADNSNMKANVYLPEYTMRDIRNGQSVRLLIDGRWRPLSGSLKQVLPAVAGLPPELQRKDQLAGINPPQYYLGTVILRNEGGLMPGMFGTAKVLVARRSIGDLCYRFARDLVDRKVW